MTRLREVGAANGLSVSEIALRWLAHHSHLKHGLNDAIITGGRKAENIEATLGMFSYTTNLSSLLFATTSSMAIAIALCEWC